MICEDLRENRKSGWRVRRTNQPAAPTKYVRMKWIPIICLKELVLIEQAFIFNTRLRLRIALCAERLYGSSPHFAKKVGERSNLQIAHCRLLRHRDLSEG